MTQQEIEKIITNEVEGSDGSYPKNVTPAAKEIYKLHLEDKIKMLNSFNFDFCHECDNSGLVYSNLEELEQELKTLEGE